MYDPNEPDDQDDTGLSGEEFNTLMDEVGMIGGYDAKIEKVGETVGEVYDQETR